MQPAVVDGLIVGASTVVAAIIGLAARAVTSKKSKISGISNSNVAVGDNINQNYLGPIHNHITLSDAQIGPLETKVASKPSLVEICRRIDSSKPFESHQVAENHIGLDVSWPVVFSAIHKAKSNSRWYVTFDDPEVDYCRLHAAVDLDLFPKLRVIDVGHCGWITGRIEDANASSVWLESNPEIELE